MFITQIYKYKKDNIVYVGGNLPKNAEIIETMDILNAEENYNLVQIAENINVGSNVWLRNGDKQENYKEIEQIKE